ncbi:MAG: SIS domain-containing protein [Thermomicrobiales bacterium]
MSTTTPPDASPHFQHYLSSIREHIAVLAGDENDRITQVAGVIAASIADGGIVHVFGSGHSNLLAQEVFYRAGGLVPFNAMLDINLTIFGSSRATLLERLEGYGPSLLTNYEVLPGEVVIVISTSGINPVPIEVAETAKANGATVVAVTSAEAYREAASRHSTGKRLVDVADFVLDTHVPVGDAIETIGGVTVGATSTILGAAIMNALVVATTERLVSSGHPVPAFVSQNVPGGDEHNNALLDRYRARIPLMKP